MSAWPIPMQIPIAATTQLNAFWGVGTLIGLLLAGIWIVPRLGKRGAARLGCQGIVVALVVPLTLLNSRTITRPISYARTVAQAIAAGDLTQRIEVEGSDEPACVIDSISRWLNP